MVFNVVDPQAGLLAAVGFGGSAGPGLIVTPTLPQAADQQPARVNERT